MPITWKELDSVLPSGVTVFDALKRLKAPDPWKGFFNVGQSLKKYPPKIPIYNNIYQLNRPQRSEKEKPADKLSAGFSEIYNKTFRLIHQAASTKFGVTVMLSGKERLLSATTFPH